MPRSDSPSGTLMDLSRLDRTRIALLASLLLVGCSWTVPSDPVTEDSPAAAYAEGFWALEASGGAAFAERSPDGTARVLVDDSGQVRVEREGRVSTILDTCADWIDGPNLSATWSRDSRALLVDARSGVPDGNSGACSDERRWTIHLLDSGESRYLPKFRGTRDEALEAAGSPSLRMPGSPRTWPPSCSRSSTTRGDSRPGCCVGSSILQSGRSRRPVRLRVRP